MKKISSHITKKVADRLNEIFKNDRKQFENKWDNLKLFIEYGMMTEEKFYEKAEKFALFKNTENKYFTFDEYNTLVKESQTDKNKTLVYLYATNVEEQYSFIDAAKAKGYDVLVMDGQLDTHYLNHLEQKFKDIRFTRVDADVIDKLIEKGENKESSLTTDQQNSLSPVFRSQLPEKANYIITFEALSENDHPIIITQAEFIRRMKDMSAMGGGMNFYGDLPDSFTMVVNSNHPLVLRINTELEKKLSTELAKIDEKIKPLSETKADLDKANKEKKEEEIKQEDKDRLEELSKKIKDLEDKKDKALKKFGSSNKLVKQIIDLALLANGMLKGEDLSRFVKRSIELI